jgi:hypothetical protein
LKFEYEKSSDVALGARTGNDGIDEPKAHHARAHRRRVDDNVGEAPGATALTVAIVRAARFLSRDRLSHEGARAEPS